MGFLEKLEEAARTAVGCRTCFEGPHVLAAAIDLAQPRWVGPCYWESSTKVAVLMLNPGSGRFRDDPVVAESLRSLTAFRAGVLSLHDLFKAQRSDMADWGRGRFMTFFEKGLGLNFDEIAFVNVAWCATADNAPPTEMLNRCFEKHTLPLLRELQPDVLLVSGSSAHRYIQRIYATLNTCRVVPCLHYAHREGKSVEALEVARLRELLAARSSLALEQRGMTTP